MYFSYFVALLFVVCPIAAHKHRAPQAIFPLVPFSIMWCYQYDMYYGNLVRRAQREAARTIQEEPERFFLPKGTGIVDQPKYNTIIGQPENYKPKLDANENVFGTIQRNLSSMHQEGKK